MKSVLLFLVLATALSFSAYTSQCNGEYEQCMSNCCATCNATVGMENNSYVCWVWATKNLDQNCMNACNYCAANFTACSGSAPGSGSDSGVPGGNGGTIYNVGGSGSAGNGSNGTNSGNPNAGNGNNGSTPGTATSGETNPLCAPLFLMLGLGVLAARR
ncbi:MAG: hypothetical protein PHS02_00975 [Candidatus ainarchaeum sp.]|nr:hypothetical protein [Candidatus ainarchaeum sp.]